MGDEFHTPVLLNEILEYLDVRKGRRYVDATVGGAGHAVEILRRGGKLLGLDRDADAIEAAREELENLEPQTGFLLVQANFSQLEEIARKCEFIDVDGVLFDLGMSTNQLEKSGRGFSFRRDEPLDMRMDQTLRVSAADLVNGLSENELYDLFSTLGEEPLAKPLARAIVRARLEKRIIRTSDLVSVISSISRSGKTLARVFQALRIAVNDELEALRQGLAGAANLLGPEGRIVVLTFHSLEDRIVKNKFRQLASSGTFQVITKRPVIASEHEIARNPRASAAKLRVAEKRR